MARQITAGIIHPVTLFDADGNSQSSSAIVPQTYSTGNASIPPANTAATVTLAAPGASSRWVIAGLYWSYDAAPTGGQLTVDVDGVTAFIEYITSGGPGFFPFTPPIRLTDNATILITLTAGGAGITGSVNVHAWSE